MKKIAIKINGDEDINEIKEKVAQAVGKKVSEDYLKKVKDTISTNGASKLVLSARKKENEDGVEFTQEIEGTKGELLFYLKELSVHVLESLECDTAEQAAFFELCLNDVLEGEDD